MKDFAAFLVVCTILLYFLLIFYINPDINGNMHPGRIIACQKAGGNGAYALRGWFQYELWCAYPDGKLFPVLDVSYPYTKSENQ